MHRYWCHQCNGQKDVIDGKCTICNGEFIQLIEHPEYNRFNTVSFVINSEQQVNEDSLSELVGVLRHMEDIRIMRMLEERDTTQLLNDTLNDDQPRDKPVVEEYIQSLVNTPLSNKNYKNICAICHENFKKDLKCTKITCDHLFHYECITKWFKTKNTCPECRYEFPTDNQ